MFKKYFSSKIDTTWLVFRREGVRGATAWDLQDREEEEEKLDRLLGIPASNDPKGFARPLPSEEGAT